LDAPLVLGRDFDKNTCKSLNCQEDIDIIGYFKYLNIP